MCRKDANKVEIIDLASLRGCRRTFAGPPADEMGKVVLTTDYPDYLPVMTFAQNDALRRRMFLAYNTRAFPGTGAASRSLPHPACDREPAGLRYLGGLRHGRPDDRLGGAT